MNALLRRLMRTDSRSMRQVREDIRDEMQSHINMMREELKADGIEGEEAERHIAERFGDESQWRAKSESVILGERIMLQKILVVLVLALAVGLGWSVWEARASRVAMQAEMGKLQEQMTILVAKAKEPSIVRQQPGFVYVDGKNLRSGPYQLSQGLTLKRLLASCGAGNLENAKHVAITRRTVEGQETKKYDAKELMSDTNLDPLLQADDMIQVL